MAKNSMKPQIRFKGFTDLPDRQAGAWEQRKLGDIGKTYGGLSGKSKEDFGHGDARFVTYMNVFSNPVGDPAMTEAIELDSRQNEVKKGDIFFTTSSETPEEVGMSCVWMENTPNTYLNSFCFGYRPIVELDLYYLAYVLRSNTVRHKFIFLAQGISRYNISKNKVMEMLIPVPNKGEQVLLGAFFKNLDNLITLHQRKYEKFVNIKKALLEKMFPQGDEKVPRIRFKGFTDLPAGRQVLGKWCVYVLACDDGSFYKGITNDLTGRISAHIKGRGAEHTKKHKPIKLVYCEAFETEKEAAAKERFLKSGSGREWLKQNLQTYKPFDDSRELSYDNDAWEQRKLGELGKAQSGIGFPDKEQGGKKGIPFFKVSDMNNLGNELEMHIANNYVSLEQIKKNGWSPIEETSVIFAKVGAAIMLNRKRLVRFPFLLDNNTMAYKFNDAWEIDFGRTLFERIDLTSLVQVGALPSYNAGDVENMEVAIPQKAEQTKLGALFTSLDNLITLHQCQVEKLKNIKSALLEKMFV